MTLINVLEVIGTIAFAISGALIGTEKELDLFGVIFLAITTSVGGGIFRDVIIGNTPPVAFVKPIYCLISMGAGVAVFIFYKRIITLKNVILITDAVGLGVFTAIGSSTAFIHDFNKPFIVISMGLITGVGGGILRDVFVKDIPFVFRKEIYAIASILGALILYFSYNHVPHVAALYICFAVTFIIRVLAIILNLNLPVFRMSTEENKENLPIK
ncbi:trimeric intracellular cation channel family protein [Clostridium bovifaecis]|uniref:Trimeric intracellular cation channel family protein n=1 Tax=Clostridium bovifaecis TaxID=2184719 RepID=A0A6I6EV12_9CLOT|nr:trimeric intracellular cation channel family protein [Clostridium bovifaecis]